MQHFLTIFLIFVPKVHHIVYNLSIKGEKYAKAYNIYNSNKSGDVLGVNIFRCTSEDNYLQCDLKAQGCSIAGSVYAKQFSANNDLLSIGSWYFNMGIQVGDIIEIEWTSPYDIIIRKI